MVLAVEALAVGEPEGRTKCARFMPYVCYTCRVKPFTLSILLASILCSCTNQVVLTEPPELVLEKTVLNMQSVEYQGYAVRLQADVTTNNVDVAVVLNGEGTIERAGQQVDFTGMLTANGYIDGRLLLLEADMYLVKDAEQNTYYRLENLVAEPTQISALLDEEIATTDTWQLIESTVDQADVDSSTTTVLYPQEFEHFELTVEGNGFNQDRNEYTYQIRLLPEAVQRLFASQTTQTFFALSREDVMTLLETHDFIGTITIDAKEYRIKMLDWQLVPKLPVAEPLLTVSIIFTTDAEPIVIPSLNE